MTSPNQPVPEGALGADFGQSLTEQRSMALMRGQALGGWESADSQWKPIIDKVFALLGEVAQGIIDGLIQAGGFVVGVVNDIIGGIVNLFANLDRAIRGEGAAGMPDAFEPGPLADIADGQRALIDQAYLLEDNAGFINLTMGKNWNIRGNANKWVPVEFDTYVTQHKNAEVHVSSIGNYSDPSGMMLRAPGVWDMKAQLTIDPKATDYRYFEAEMRVMRWVKTRYSVNDPWIYSPIQEYSSTRVVSSSAKGQIHTLPILKPLLIPTMVAFNHDEAGNVLGEDFGFKVHVFVRFQTAAAWTLWGGTIWSSLSANRLSADTTDYSPPSAGVGTGTITEGAV